MDFHSCAKQGGNLIKNTGPCLLQWKRQLPSNLIFHTIPRGPIYRDSHSITAGAPRLNLRLSNGWHPIVYCQGTRILFWLRGMIIKGSNHRWQAQIRWKKCWTTIHAFQELKQGNTEILGTARPRENAVHCKYIRCNFYSFKMCPTFHCNPEIS